MKWSSVWRGVQAARVPLNEYEFPASKLANVQAQLERLVEKNYYLHQSAREAYRSFLLSYNSHQLKAIFNVHRLDLAAVARSFGFSAPPKACHHPPFPPPHHRAPGAHFSDRFAGCNMAFLACFDCRKAMAVVFLRWSAIQSMADWVGSLQLIAIRIARLRSRSCVHTAAGDAEPGQQCQEGAPWACGRQARWWGAPPPLRQLQC